MTSRLKPRISSVKKISLTVELGCNKSLPHNIQDFIVSLYHMPADLSTEQRIENVHPKVASLAIYRQGYPKILKRINVGPAYGYLTSTNHTRQYRNFALTLSEDPAKSCFLEDLSNGGERGRGKHVVYEAIRWCEFNNINLFIYVFSLRDVHDYWSWLSQQSRLLRWYLSLGLFSETKIPYLLFRNIVNQK